MNQPSCFDFGLNFLKIIYFLFLRLAVLDGMDRLEDVG
jgi:hypothetical protein